MTTAFEVDGGMTETLRESMQSWADSFCREHGCTLWVVDKIFDSLDDAMAFTGKCYGSHLLALRYRNRDVNKRVVHRLSGRLNELRDKKRRLLLEIAPWNRSSRTMSCKKCGTRYVCSELEQCNRYNCSFCGDLLLSDTNKARLSGVNLSIAELERRLAIAEKGSPSKMTAWYVECRYVVD